MRTSLYSDLSGDLSLLVNRVYVLVDLVRSDSCDENSDVIPHLVRYSMLRVLICAKAAAKRDDGRDIFRVDTRKAEMAVSENCISKRNSSIPASRNNVEENGR